MAGPSDSPGSAAVNGGQAAFLPPLTADDGPSGAVVDTRPEILVGAAFAGGLLLAKLLGRARGR